MPTDATAPVETLPEMLRKAATDCESLGLEGDWRARARRVEKLRELADYLTLLPGLLGQIEEGIARWKAERL